MTPATVSTPITENQQRMSTPAIKPLITIAIPTYNSADRYLRGSIESARVQTYGDLEIIVSDNSSTDNTQEVVEGIGDGRIRYIKHEKSLGPNGNFNFCVNQARGDYVLVLHDDDLIDKDFLEVCMKRAEYSTDHSFIRTGARIIDAAGQVIRSNENVVEEHTPEALYRAWFTDKTEVYYCSTLFNTKALREVGGFRSPYNQLEDGYAIVALAPRRDWVDIREVKASFRKSPGQLTYHVPVREWCGDFVGLLDIMCKQLEGDTREFRALGNHFFGMRALDRAQKKPTRLSRIRAGLTVARFFGPGYFPWGRLGPLARPIFRAVAPTPVH